MIGLGLSLLLPTPTICFTLDHKRNVSDGVVSGIRERFFSLNHKLYASDYDSVASENQRKALGEPVEEAAFSEFFKIS